LTCGRLNQSAAHRTCAWRNLCRQLYHTSERIHGTSALVITSVYLDRALIYYHTRMRFITQAESLRDIRARVDKSTPAAQPDNNSYNSMQSSAGSRRWRPACGASFSGVGKLVFFCNVRPRQTIDIPRDSGGEGTDSSGGNSDSGGGGGGSGGGRGGGGTGGGSSGGGGARGGSGNSNSDGGGGSSGTSEGVSLSRFFWSKKRSAVNVLSTGDQGSATNGGKQRLHVGGAFA
jgi:hypothetical protein